MSAIDARAHLPRRAGQPGRGDANLGRWFGRSAGRFFDGGSLDEMVAEMDDAGVDRAVLVTAPGRDPSEGRGQGRLATTAGYSDVAFRELCTEIAESVSAFPDRFTGMAMLDPMGGMAAVRQVERAKHEFGFAGCAVMPALIGRPASDPCYLSICAKCEELELPLTINVGIPGPMRPGSVQSPQHLETLALSFPDLTLIGTHVGHPWHEQMVDLLTRFDNVYLMTSAWAPKYLPASLVEFLDGPGVGKVMWATDYPLLPFDRCLAEITDLDLGQAAEEALLWRTALDLFWPEDAPQLDRRGCKAAAPRDAAIEGAGELN